MLFAVAELLVQPTAKTRAPIFTIGTSNNVVSRKYVPFGGSENKILHFNHISLPQEKRKFLAKIFHGTETRQKGLKMGMLVSKLPLIVIVAS